jgi:proton-translocating NADH-quinone oxidoreductase chain L
MPELSSYLWLIPVLPLLACTVITLATPMLRGTDGQSVLRYSHWPCVLAIIASFLLSLLVFQQVYTGSLAEPVVKYPAWIQVGEPGAVHAVDVTFSLRADPLSAMMLVMITFIASSIAIYSIGYMHGDEGYPRFFAEIALFVFMMTTLVLADNFLLLYLGWEGVGLCSYLLIGFWFTKPEAAAAARKAFLVTRIGDVGLLLGILLLWVTFDYHLDYATILNPAAIAGQDKTVILGACLLLFCGACGKSAQFPLHVWLPDAMEGPTPVSALIHAATMVTAGVYLVARCTPLFVAAPEAQLTVACIGGFTALLAALIALTQNDLKRILAYSTISQLGYMFLGLGSGMKGLAAFAATAALFHLFTHAFFKALLFLGAGSVMHAMGNVIDIRRLGGLRRIMPITHLTFLAGALALAGFPFFSGFWSKDEILAATWQASGGETFASWYLVLWVLGMATAGLTPFYTFRAYFCTFQGQEVIPPEAGEHAHESPRVMTVPLVVLAVFSVGVGFVIGPLMPEGLRFAHFLEPTRGFASQGEPAIHWGLMVLSGVIALAGIGVAYLMYVARPELPGQIARSAQAAYQLSLNKFGIDEIYDALILKPLDGFTRFTGILDLRVIDATVDLVGHLPRLLGVLLRPVQNGLVQFYALAMLLGLTVFLVTLILVL